MNDLESRDDYVTARAQAIRLAEIAVAALNNGFEADMPGIPFGAGFAVAERALIAAAAWVSGR